MDSFSRKEIVIGRLKFITMSLIGILLFLVPIPVEQDGQKQTTLPVAFLAGVLKDVLGGVMPFLIVTIITLSGIITLICSTILKDKLKPDGLMNNAFNVRIGWLILRILAVVFAWMTFLRIGSKVIYSDETGRIIVLKFIANISGSILICSSIFTAINGIRFVRDVGSYF